MLEGEKLPESAYPKPLNNRQESTDASNEEKRVGPRTEENMGGFFSSRSQTPTNDVQQPSAELRKQGESPIHNQHVADNLASNDDSHAMDSQPASEQTTNVRHSKNAPDSSAVDQDHEAMDDDPPHKDPPEDNARKETPVPLTNEASTHKKPTPREKDWLNPQYHHNSKLIKKPHELIALMEPPPDVVKPKDKELLDRIQGSMLGMAIGDALGAHVEFRPHEYLVAHAVTDFASGGTWGLAEGQFTDDTSMALCLANSLIFCKDFNPYDQLVRYKWWHEKGYMSSTGECFDIGAATKQSIDEFGRRQRKLASTHNISVEEIDFVRDPKRLKNIDVYCSDTGVAGNGALMRLAPVPLFFHRHPELAVEYSGESGQITHGDVKARDACRYYGALIVAALQGYSKEQLLDTKFYSKRKDWFGEEELDPAIKVIAEGSYRNEKGYDGGIRGGGYIVKALEAALWAFWSTNKFEDGALAAVNLGDDTDTTAAIYGQLAGAVYTTDKLPSKWVDRVYAKDFILNISKWLQYEGERWSPKK